MFTTRHGEGKARLPCELRTIVFDKSENSLGMDKFIPLHSVLRTGKDEPRGAPSWPLEDISDQHLSKNEDECPVAAAPCYQKLSGRRS